MDHRSLLYFMTELISVCPAERNSCLFTVSWLMYICHLGLSARPGLKTQSGRLPCSSTRESQLICTAAATTGRANMPRKPHGWTWRASLKARRVVSMTLVKARLSARALRYVRVRPIGHRPGGCGGCFGSTVNKASVRCERNSVSTRSMVAARAARPMGASCKGRSINACAACWTTARRAESRSLESEEDRLSLYSSHFSGDHRLTSGMGVPGVTRDFRGGGR